MNVQEELAKFVNDTMLAKSLSGYDVEEKALRAGLKITQSYVNRIKNGKVGNMGVPKQKALAIGLGVNPQEIYDIVNGISRKPSSFADELLAVAAGTEFLTDEQNTFIIQTVRRLVAAMQAENDRDKLIKQKPETFDEKGIAKEEFQFELTKKDKKTA